MNSVTAEIELHSIREEIRDLKPMIWRIDRDISDLRQLIVSGKLRVRAGWLAVLSTLIFLEGVIIIGLLYKLTLMSAT